MSEFPESPPGVEEMLDGLPGIEMDTAGPFGIPTPRIDASGVAPPPGFESGDSTGVSSERDPKGSGGENTSPDRGRDGVAELEDAIEAGESYIDKVDRAIDHEDCEFCRAVLMELRGRPLEEQVQGVRELKRLKESMDRDISEEKVEEMLDQFDVVDESVMF